MAMHKKYAKFPVNPEQKWEVVEMACSYAVTDKAPLMKMLEQGSKQHTAIYQALVALTK